MLQTWRDPKVPNPAPHPPSSPNHGHPSITASIFCPSGISTINSWSVTHIANHTSVLRAVNRFTAYECKIQKNRSQTFSHGKINEKQTDSYKQACRNLDPLNNRRSRQALGWKTARTYWLSWGAGRERSVCHDREPNISLSVPT